MRTAPSRGPASARRQEGTAARTREDPEDPPKLRREAARLRAEARSPRLTHPEREAMLGDADWMERRAAVVEGQRAIAPAPARLEEPPPPPPHRPFHATPAQRKAYASNAATARLAAEAAAGQGDAPEASRLRKRAAGWEAMSRGMMPPGWTPSGPPGSRGKRPAVEAAPAWDLIQGDLDTAPIGALLEATCHCGRTERMPIAEIVPRLGGGGLRDLMGRLRCRGCHARPSAIVIIKPPGT